MVTKIALTTQMKQTVHHQHQQELIFHQTQNVIMVSSDAGMTQDV